MIVRDAHQSGFHGVTQAQWNTMILSIGMRAGVGFTTESVGFTMPTGWDSRGKESRVVFDTTRWSCEASGKVSIPTPTWHRGTEAMTAVDIQWGLMVHHRAQLRLLRFGGHLPAHLFRKTQAAANATALDGLADVIQTLTREHTPDMRTGSFDFNRSLTRASQQKTISEAIAGTGLRLVVPPHATRGLRTIDGFITDGDLASAGMLDRAKGFDHRGASLKSCGCAA